MTDISTSTSTITDTSTVTIIGSGAMAAAIGIRAAKNGHTVELMSRSAAKAEALAAEIGRGTTVGTYGARPAGDIVIVAVLFAGAVEVVTHFGDALAGKTIVDITNPFNADGSGLATTAGDSVAERMAAVAPDGAHVVKALNTLFGGVIAADTGVDALFAGDGDGDGAESKARVAGFIESLGLRPLDAGGLEMAHALEWAGLLLVGVARNGVGFDVALGVEAV